MTDTESMDTTQANTSQTAPTEAKATTSKKGISLTANKKIFSLKLKIIKRNL